MGYKSKYSLCYFENVSCLRLFRFLHLLNIGKIPMPTVIRVPTLIRDVIVAILNFRADSTVSIAESVCFDFHALAISQCV